MIAFILDVYVTQIATKNKKFMIRDYRRGDTLEDIDDVGALTSPYRPVGIERIPERFEEESPRLRQSSSDVNKLTELSPSNKPSGLRLLSKEKET